MYTFKRRLTEFNFFIDFALYIGLVVFIIVSVLLYSVICVYFCDDVSGFCTLSSIKLID